MQAALRNGLGLFSTDWRMDGRGEIGVRRRIRIHRFSFAKALYHNGGPRRGNFAVYEGGDDFPIRASGGDQAPGQLDVGMQNVPSHFLPIRCSRTIWSRAA